MSRKLTDDAIARAAFVLKCEVAAIRAVLAVEAGGEGFLPDGRPKILFERHIFHRLTEGKFGKDYPALSNQTPGGYSGNEAEYPRLYRAMQLDGEAAIQSASWGIAQLMGFNWKECGEKTLYGFLMAVHNNEDAQLGLMAGFLKSKGLGPALAAEDWAAVAKGYNGAGYKINKYDVKLKAAFERMQAQYPESHRDHLMSGKAEFAARDAQANLVPPPSTAKRIPQVVADPVVRSPTPEQLARWDAEQTRMDQMKAGQP